MLKKRYLIYNFFLLKYLILHLTKDAAVLDLNDSSLYLNRELSWLKFNTRVLAQSLKKDLPLFERLKFLAIYATNLDEFYMIRVAGLKQLFSAGVIETGADQKTPLDQLREIRAYLASEKEVIQASYNEIVKDLEQENLFVKNYEELSPALAKLSDNYFFSNILPVIVPIAVNATHPFPHLNNLSFSLAVKLQDRGSDNRACFCTNSRADDLAEIT